VRVGHGSNERCAAAVLFARVPADGFLAGDLGRAMGSLDRHAGRAGCQCNHREYGGCVIQEAFDGGPATGGLIGHSVSTYHAPLQRWRQTWVDNQGGYFALVGGPEGDDFILVSSRVSNGQPAQRMVFEDITPGAFTWRWQRTPDAGATWADQWVIHYTRRAPG
jgi:hypothetical protein